MLKIFQKSFIVQELISLASKGLCDLEFVSLCKADSQQSLQPHWPSISSWNPQSSLPLRAFVLASHSAWNVLPTLCNAYFLNLFGAGGGLV